MNKIEIGKKLFDQTVGLLNRSLDVRTARHRVISSNVANAETPNYAPREIPFQKILERAAESSSAIPLSRTHPRHFPDPAVLTSDFSPELETRPAGDPVHIDEEMAKLAENNLMFQAGVQSLVKKIEALKMTISEGR
jgi:flagellar basal-body rod protein FlgB